MKNKMILVLEGPDNTGKTNIAKKLAEVYNLSYFKRSTDAENFRSGKFHEVVIPEMNLTCDLLSQVSFKENGIVFDRSLATELVYANVFKRVTRMDDIWLLDERFASLGAKFILCYKSKYEVYEDELIDISNIEALNMYYRYYSMKTKMPVLNLDTTDENLDEQIRKIDEWLITFSVS